jgi:hypothetical protein
MGSRATNGGTLSRRLGLLTVGSTIDLILSRGACKGWFAGRRGGHTPAFVAGVLALIGYSPSCRESAFATVKAWPPQTAHVHSRPCLPPRHKLGTGGTVPTCALAAVRHISRLSKVPQREQRRPQRSSITGTVEDKACPCNRHISATVGGDDRPTASTSHKPGRLGHFNSALVLRDEGASPQGFDRPQRASRDEVHPAQDAMPQSEVTCRRGRRHSRASLMDRMQGRSSSPARYQAHRSDEH